jgi:hypothetical protein
MSAMPRGQLVASASPAPTVEYPVHACQAGLPSRGRPWPPSPCTWPTVQASGLTGLLPMMASSGLIVVTDSPSQYEDLLSLLREFFTLHCVDTVPLQDLVSCHLQYSGRSSLPYPKPSGEVGKARPACHLASAECALAGGQGDGQTFFSPSITTWLFCPTGTTGE